LVLSALFALRGWVAVLVTAVAAYIPIYVMYDYFINGNLLLPFKLTSVPLLYYDYFTYPDQIFTLGITVVLIVAIGAHAASLWKDVKTLWVRVRKMARSA
jgi:hypothetical protein